MEQITEKENLIVKFGSAFGLKILSRVFEDNLNYMKFLVDINGLMMYSWSATVGTQYKYLLSFLL